MAGPASRHGVTKNADLDPALLNRETRPFRLIARQVVAEIGWMLFVVFGFITFMFPEYTDFILLVSFLFWLYARNKRPEYPYRVPIFEKISRKKRGTGIIFLGNDLDDGSGVWFSDDDLRTHSLFFGSTGSGKTRSLMGFLYQALLFGSGCIYVDGKGDNTVYWLVWSICRRLDRIDDLLIINYLTGGVENAGENSNDRLSNTTNPFANGTSDQLRELVVGLMRDSGGDGDMWKGRASALLSGLLRCLVSLRDRGELHLNVETIRDHMPLDKVVQLTRRTDLSDYAILPLRKYLLELPGFTEDDANAGDISPKAYEQHGYLTMQLTETLGDLGDTYGHIFKTPLGEVDFKDVVFNRRVLFVMLPALEKSPDSLGNLGKLVVASVRSALAPALGNKLEGSRRDVIEVKPTNTDVPFLLVLDEYGYYSVKGFAVVAAQARSLGIGVVFAGQDYPSFKKGSAEEAASVVANTNIKICMKLEDPDETFQLYEKRAGKAHVTVSTGHEMKGALVTYKDQNATRFEERSRINVRDLVSQNPGMAHILFGDTLTRAQLFYAVPKEVKSARLNSFLAVKGPSKSTLDSIQGVFDKLDDLFGKSSGRSRNSKNRASNTTSGKRVPPRAKDTGLTTFINDYFFERGHQKEMKEASIYAIGMLEYRNTVGDEELIKEGNSRRGEIQRRIQVERKRLLEESPDRPRVDLDPDEIESVRAGARGAIAGSNELMESMDDPVRKALENLEAAQARAASAALDIETDKRKSVEEIEEIERRRRKEQAILDREIEESDSEKALEQERRLQESRKMRRNTPRSDHGGFDGHPPSADSLASQASDFSKLVELAMNQVIATSTFGPEQNVSDDEIDSSTPRNQLKAIEMALGRSAEEAEEQADIGMRMLANTVVYPNKPLPTKETLVSVEQNMRSLRKRLDDFGAGM